LADEPLLWLLVQFVAGFPTKKLTNDLGTKPHKWQKSNCN